MVRTLSTLRTEGNFFVRVCIYKTLRADILNDNIFKSFPFGEEQVKDARYPLLYIRCSGHQNKANE